VGAEVDGRAPLLEHKHKCSHKPRDLMACGRGDDSISFEESFAPG
jgi:hypothetical protein